MFRIGQRVRIVAPDWLRIHEKVKVAPIVGKVFTVKSVAGLLSTAYPEQICYDIGFTKPCEACILEPAYDGDLPSTWSECAWKPNQLPTQPTEKSNGIRRRITQTSRGG